jgi:hypothetical protein
MPGIKRGILSSPNPVKHIYIQSAADAVMQQPQSDCPPVTRLHIGGSVDHDDCAVTAHDDASHICAVIQNSADVPETNPDGCEAADKPRSLGGPAVEQAPCQKGISLSDNADRGVPPSPVSNRERFIKGFLPARTCCNLDLVRSSAGTKFNLVAICIAVFPKSSNPERRYIQLADTTGSVGVTVWNANADCFNNASVGRLVTLTKVVITNHNGKKALTMARDSSVQQVDDEMHTVSIWWKSLLNIPPLSCGSVHDVADNSMVSVCGILGFVSAETKMVQGVPKTLLTLHLVDSSGKVDVRSWNHTPDSFNRFVNAPILIRRVRVTSFASTKLCELLDGTGSVIETTFPGDSALIKFWNE